MKAVSLLCLSFLFFNISAVAQIVLRQAPGTCSEVNRDILTGALPRSQETLPLNDTLLIEFESRMKRARKTNAIAIGMGGVANLSMVINGGFLDPDDIFENYKPVVALLGIGTGTAQVIISFNTIRQLNCAEDALSQYSGLTGNSNNFSSTLGNLRAAKNLSIAIPLLGAASFSFMIGGYIAYNHNNENAMDFCFTAGWVCLGTSLLTSVINQVMIAKTIKTFHGEAASVQLGANCDGTGVCLRF